MIKLENSLSRVDMQTHAVPAVDHTLFALDNLVTSNFYLLLFLSQCQCIASICHGFYVYRL